MRRAVAALALTLLVTACSAVPTRQAGPEPSTLAQYYQQHLDWQSCDNGFQCARLLVPFDYTHPAKDRFDLPVVKLPAAKPSQRTPALRVLAGAVRPAPGHNRRGAPPILVVGTTRDPATPYRWAQALAGDLSSGVLLGWNGDGHTAYGQGSACVDTIVNDYLFSLKVPRGGTVCA